MKKLFFLIIVSVVIGACKTSNKATVTEKAKVMLDSTYTTDSGLKYKFIKLGTGVMPQNGDKVSVHYTGKLTNDTIFDSSVKRGTPFTFTLGAGEVIKGWDEGIAKLHVGDKAVFTIPPQLAYGDMDKGTIPPNSTLIFEVELLDVKEQPKPYDVKGKDTLTTASGLKYMMVSSGKGKQVKAGMKIGVHYTGFFMDGKIFDSSVSRGEPISFNVGTGRVIKGWDEGLQLLKVGDKARLVIPYQLAYGEKGRGPIPAKATLIFDVEVMSAEDAPIPVTPVPYDVKGKDTLTTASGLRYIKIIEGAGPQAIKGKTVNVHYTGYFLDGKIFDSSVSRGEPLSFELGAGRVIKGWDEGIALLKVGGKARLIIPYQLAYGEAGMSGAIPPKADLIFDVELVGIK